MDLSFIGTEWYRERFYFLVNYGSYQRTNW